MFDWKYSYDIDTDLKRLVITVPLSNKEFNEILTDELDVTQIIYDALTHISINNLYRYHAILQFDIDGGLTKCRNLGT